MTVYSQLVYDSVKAKCGQSRSYLKRYYDDTSTTLALLVFGNVRCRWPDDRDVSAVPSSDQPLQSKDISTASACRDLGPPLLYAGHLDTLSSLGAILVPTQEPDHVRAVSPLYIRMHESTIGNNTVWRGCLHRMASIGSKSVRPGFSYCLLHRNSTRCKVPSRIPHPPQSRHAIVTRAPPSQPLNRAYPPPIIITQKSPRSFKGPKDCRLGNWVLRYIYLSDAGTNEEAAREKCRTNGKMTVPLGCGGNLFRVCCGGRHMQGHVAKIPSELFLCNAV